MKLFLAVAMTPFIYLGHWAVEKYLGKSMAETLAERAALESGRRGGPASPELDAAGAGESADL